MEDLKTFAIKARAALLTGLSDHQTIIAHADRMILETENPDKFLVDISLSSPGMNDLLQIINDYLKDNPSEPEGSSFIAIIAKRYFSGDFTAERATKSLYKIIFETSIPDEEKSKIRNLELNFEPFMPMRREEAVIALENYLQQYKDLTFADLF